MGIIFVLGMLLLTILPYIICGILVGIVIWLIKTKFIKSTILKILIIISILFGICILLYNIKDESPNDLYVEMKEIVDNQSLIGLSKEQVVILLGEPVNEYKNSYRYNAGHIGKGLFVFNKAILFDCYVDYALYVDFDENDKVEITSIQCVP